MGLSKYTNEIKSDFDLFGLLGVEFISNQNYEAFIAKRKKHKYRQEKIRQ